MATDMNRGVSPSASVESLPSESYDDEAIVSANVSDDDVGSGSRASSSLSGEPQMHEQGVMLDDVTAERIVSDTNRLFVQLGIDAKPIPSFAELQRSASSMFVAIFEKFFQVRLRNVKRKPRVVTHYVQNAQLVINALSAMLSIELSHITGESIYAGEPDKIIQLMDIFEALVTRYSPRAAGLGSEPSTAEGSDFSGGDPGMNRFPAYGGGVPNAAAAAAAAGVGGAAETEHFSGVSAARIAIYHQQQQELQEQRIRREQREQMEQEQQQDQQEREEELQERQYLEDQYRQEELQRQQEYEAPTHDQEDSAAAAAAMAAARLTRPQTAPPSTHIRDRSSDGSHPTKDGHGRPSSSSSRRSKQRRRRPGVGGDNVDPGANEPSEQTGRAKIEEGGKKTKSKRKKRVKAAAAAAADAEERRAMAALAESYPPVYQRFLKQRMAWSRKILAAGNDKSGRARRGRSKVERQVDEDVLRHKKMYKQLLRHHVRALRKREQDEKRAAEYERRSTEYERRLERVRSRRLDEDLQREQLSRRLHRRSAEDRLVSQLFHRALKLERSRLLDQRKSEQAMLNSIEQHQKMRYEAAETFFHDRKNLLGEQLLREQKERVVASRARKQELRKVVKDLRLENAQELKYARDRLWQEELRFEFLEEENVKKLFDSHVDKPLNKLVKAHILQVYGRRKNVRGRHKTAKVAKRKAKRHRRKRRGVRKNRQPRKIR